MAIDIKKKSKRGFASLDKARLRDICSRGGKRAQELGTAHRWSSEEAQEAGRVGGRKSRKRRKGEQLV